MQHEIGNAVDDVSRVRSALFVPANRAEFLRKAVATAADALIVDLEDSVPDIEKDNALAAFDQWLAERKEDPAVQVLCARINPVDGERLADELEVAVRGGVRVVMVPKVAGPEAVTQVDRALTYLEGARGVPCGLTRIWPIAETARGVLRSYEIATASPRVAYMGGGVSTQGDIARELGCLTSVDGSESLYLRSKVLLDVRAAGVPNPITGVVTEVADLQRLRAFAEASRQLGYEGMMVIHPSHIEIVNEIFSPSAAELSSARELIAALDGAEREGRASVTFDGRMIDIAMRKSAELLLQRDARPEGERRAARTDGVAVRNSAHDEEENSQT